MVGVMKFFSGFTVGLLCSACGIMYIYKYTLGASYTVGKDLSEGQLLGRTEMNVSVSTPRDVEL